MTDDTGKKFNPLVVKGAAILTGTINGVLEFAGEKFFAGLLGKGFSGFSKKTIKQMLKTRSGRQLIYESWGCGWCRCDDERGGGSITTGNQCCNG